jgi:branched-chain amino acid transport system permease protein
MSAEATAPTTAPSTIATRGRELRPSFVEAWARFLAPMGVGLVIATILQATLPSADKSLQSKIILDIGINIVLAVSLNIVNGFTGQFSMGHAGFMAVGGYIGATITYYGSFLLWEKPVIHEGAAGPALFVLATVVAGLVAAGLGYVVGLPSLRLRGDYLAIVTLGFGEIVRVLVQITGEVLTSVDDVKATPYIAKITKAAPDSTTSFLGMEIEGGLVTKLGGALGFSGIDGIPTYTNHFWTFTFVALTLIAAYRMKVSSWGRAFLSVRENEIAAEAMGVHTTKVKVRAFVISAFFAGLAGSLYGHEIGSLNPGNLGFMKSFDIIIMVVLGGMGSVSGAVLAAIILTILPEALSNLAEFRMIIYALLLIVMMLVRPQGLFGIREIWELGFVKNLIGERR